MPAPKDPKKYKSWIQKIRVAKIGYEFSQESKDKMSKSHEGMKNNWTGGDAAYWAIRMKEIYTECVLCKSDIRLEMHHRDEDPKNNERFNRVVLCGKCHDYWHHN